MPDDPDDPDDPETPPVHKAAWVRGAEASSVGIELAISICAPMIGAHYLEQHVTHWSPWTTLVGVFLGLVMAGIILRRTTREMSHSFRADRDDEDSSP